MKYDKYTQCLIDNCGDYLAELLSSLHLKTPVGQVLLNCHFVTDDDERTSITPFGYWFFRLSKSCPFIFLNNGDQVNMFVIGQGMCSVFSSLVTLIDAFAKNIQKFQDRSNLVRQNPPEISKSFFSAALATAIDGTDLYKTAILVENIEGLGKTFIRFFPGSSSKSEMRDITHFLKYAGFVEWDSSAIMKRETRNGKVEISKDVAKETETRISLIYETWSSDDFSRFGEITKTEAMVLSYVKKNARANQSSLVNKLGFCKRTASRSLASLARKGYLTATGRIGRKGNWYVIRK